jgi:propanol-preferring alcohol dehydrogenase
MTGLPDTMQAWRLATWGQDPELVELPVPVPVGEQVLLRVEAAGLCHSDLHIMAAAPGQLPYQLPFTLGHEVVGVVAATGDPVAHAWVGRRVAVHGVWSCGRCRRCRRGRDNYCFELTGPIGNGIGYDGGLADYMLVPSSRHLVAADDADPIALAPLTDAGLTAHHALQCVGADLRGATVVVIGIGGLGHLALQLLSRKEAACVVGVDPRAEARALGLRLGADAVVPTATDAADWLDGCSHGSGADVVLDFVGAQDTMNAAARLLAPGGRITVVGSAGGRLEVAKRGALPRGWGISAPFWGTHQDLADVVAIAGSGGVHAQTETYTLGEAMTAYDRLRRGLVQGRAVVSPGA